jgi:ribose transport system permease protein
MTEGDRHGQTPGGPWTGRLPVPLRRALSSAWDGVRRRSLSEWLVLVGPVIALVAIYLLFTILIQFRLAEGEDNPFLRLGNVETIARQTAVVGIAALGMTLVIISGGIDLSVGSAIAFASVVVAALLRDAGAGAVAAALGGIAAGAVCGLANGLVITGLKVVPFIATLGMMLVVRGGAKWLADEQKIDAPTRGLDGLLASLGPGEKWRLFPPGVWSMVALAVGIFVLLRYTRFGKHAVAIGSNEQTARLCGVAVERTKITIYVIGGAFAGLAGLMQFSRLTVGDPTTAMGKELDVIAAVVIGGGSLSGGEGSVLGSLVGALIMTVIGAGCTQMGWPTYVQQIATGVIIVVAVALDRLRRRRTG